MCLSLCLSVCRPVSRPVRQSVCLPLPLFLSLFLSLYFFSLSLSLSISSQSRDDGNGQKKEQYVSEIASGNGGGDEKPLYEGSRVMALNRERDSFADVRRKRVDEYGKEIREAKVGI